MRAVEYGADLSAIHHEGFGGLARDAGPAIIRLLRTARIRSGLIVDLGCGSGILAAHLSASGYEVLGIDRSAAMLRIARTVAPDATFIRGRAEDVPLPRCAAVIATGESITYLTGRMRPLLLLTSHIRRVARALAPGGLFVFDCIVAGRSPMAYATWRTSKDWDVLAEVREDQRRGVVTRRIVTFTRKGARYRRSEEEHRVGVYDRQAVLHRLRAHGFRARVGAAYGRTPMPRRAVFVARLSR
jgi:SAM-dependent methyltransferase